MKGLRTIPRCALFLVLAAVTVLAGGCATAPYTGRQQVLMVSQEQELALGYQAFQQLKAHSRPAQDPRLQEMARRVGERLARAAARPDFRWEFVVFQNDRMANAFCLPGGKVGIYTGLFKYIKSDADLATVMAHETAHVLARHAGERVSQRTMSQLGGMLLGVGLAAARVPAPAGQVAQMGYGLGSQVGVLLPYSRLQEAEADRIGLILMAKAGYDPEDAVRFWERFAAAKKDKLALPEFLSSHPSDAERIRQLRAALVEAKRYYVATAPETMPAGPPGSPQAKKSEPFPPPSPPRGK
jgi:predicted Zn-dependent protease